MAKPNAKIYKWLIRAGIAAVLAAMFSYLQLNMTKVSADLMPVTVNIGHLDFGPAFPGLVLEKNFVVSYGDNGGFGAPYRIVQKIKPLPGAVVPDGYPGTVSEYCQENPGDSERCYKNLCPYLVKLTREGEGDIEAGSMVGPDDLFDVWAVNLEVPAIVGQVAQDHNGGIISVNGEYGCDISIDVMEE